MLTCSSARRLRVPLPLSRPLTHAGPAPRRPGARAPRDAPSPEVRDVAGMPSHDDNLVLVSHGHACGVAGGGASRTCVGMRSGGQLAARAASPSISIGGATRPRTRAGGRSAPPQNAFLQAWMPHSSSSWVAVRVAGSYTTDPYVCRPWSLFCVAQHVWVAGQGEAGGEGWEEGGRAACWAQRARQEAGGYPRAPARGRQVHGACTTLVPTAAG